MGSHLDRIKKELRDDIFHQVRGQVHPQVAEVIDSLMWDFTDDDQ